MYSGLGSNLSNLYLLTDAQTRSISAENIDGKKGMGGMAAEGPGKEAARDLGIGWKISPCITIKAGELREIANIEGPGAIQHIWMTCTGTWRHTILRIYWNDSESPSVECPIGDFFACAYQGHFSQISSIPVCVNPGCAFNCYWEMPFKKKCRITVENMAQDNMTLFYQIDYTLTDIPDDIAYFHAQFRRTNPLPYKEPYVILDGVKGKGQFVGVYMAWSSNSTGWWGEGEIKVFLDGDTAFPTICGTGTEDYFCGSYCFTVGDKYVEYTTPYAGMPLVIRGDGLWGSQQRFSLYRWHITDPIRFHSDIAVTIQALGWRSGGRYLPLRDDISSVAFWYQTLPAVKFPALPSKDDLEII